MCIYPISLKLLQIFQLTDYVSLCVKNQKLLVLQLPLRLTMHRRLGNDLEQVSLSQLSVSLVADCVI